jgi:hypothetical protein
VTPTPWPLIFADTKYDIHKQEYTQMQQGWSFGYYDGFTRHEFTHFGELNSLKEYGWYLPNSTLKMASTTITTNTQLNCPTKDKRNLDISALWTNGNKWPSKKISVYIELYHEKLCGDGINAQLLIDNKLFVHETSL